MGVVDTSQNFNSTDTITSAKLNNIIDDTFFTATALSGSTLQIVSPGKLAVAAGGITANELAANSVITTKIPDSNIITAKIADLNVTTGKLADGAVTTVKIPDLNITTEKVADAAITSAKLSGAQTGSAPVYGIRAWVKFAGSNGAISESGNVTSVVRNATGNYTITMTSALPDANYVVMGTAQLATASSRGMALDVDTNFVKTTTEVKVRTINVNSDPAPADCGFAYVAIIR